MKERIKELLWSTDKESRLLGLSYLDGRKHLRDVVYVLAPNKESNIWWKVVPIQDAPHKPYVINDILTEILEDSGIPKGISNDSLLDLYIDHCYHE